VEQRGCQETTEESADDADNDIADNTVTATSHDKTSQPTGNQTNNNPCQYTHFSYLLKNKTEFDRYVVYSLPEIQLEPSQEQADDGKQKQETDQSTSGKTPSTAIWPNW
jgi:hypothetical protein